MKKTVLYFVLNIIDLIVSSVVMIKIVSAMVALIIITVIHNLYLDINLYFLRTKIKLFNEGINVLLLKEVKMKVVIYTKHSKKVMKYWWIAPLTAIGIGLVYTVCKKK